MIFFLFLETVLFMFVSPPSLSDCVMPQASFCGHALPITHVCNLQVAFCLVTYFMLLWSGAGCTCSVTSAQLNVLQSCAHSLVLLWLQFVTLEYK